MARPLAIAHFPGPDDVRLDGELDRDALLRVARDRWPLVLEPAARERMEASHAALMRAMRRGKPVYGASSGVGDLRTRGIGADEWGRFQLNLLRSHSCATGHPLPPEVVRAAMAARIAVFARGYSAVRPRLAEMLVEMLNRQVHPVVPSCGSVGASGDTALLAHVGLAAVGEGMAQIGDGRRRPAQEALGVVGLAPLELHPREGLALVNGLDFSIGGAVLTHADAVRLLRWSDAIAALALDALQGSLGPFVAEVQRLRGDGAHVQVAERIRELCAERGPSDDRDTDLQDPYCLRCIPLVHGASWGVAREFEAVVDHELAAVIDNPLTFPDESIHHCGHFHGQRLAMAADYLTLALVNTANIAHARTSALLRGLRGLPPMLSREPGLESGLMMVETTSASLLARMRAQATPLSIQNIAVSAEQEDHVSMAWEATKRCHGVMRSLADVLAVEALVAISAARHRGLAELGAGTRRVAMTLGRQVAHRDGDASVANELGRIADFLRTNPCGAAQLDALT